MKYNRFTPELQRCVGKRGGLLGPAGREAGVQGWEREKHHRSAPQPSRVTGHPQAGPKPGQKRSDALGHQTGPYREPSPPDPHHSFPQERPVRGGKGTLLYLHLQVLQATVVTNAAMRVLTKEMMAKARWTMAREQRCGGEVTSNNHAHA